MKTSTLLLLFIVGIPPALVAAQTPRVAAAIKQIPTQGPSTKAFVPPGWMIYSEASGDLNGDGIADAALTISLSQDAADKLNSQSGDNIEWPPYIVVILFGQRDGGFSRSAVNGRLYPANSGDGPLTLKIARGVLVTNQNYRDGWAVDTTFRYRYDSAANKMLLIGFDLENYSRTNDYEGRKISENYLTNTRIESAKSGDPRSQSRGYKTVGQKTISRSPIPFEEVWFNDKDEDVFNIRPYADSPASTNSAPTQAGGYVASKPSINGTWEWRSAPNRNKEQTYFSIDIKQTGAKVSGRYWINQITDGEGDDASFVPFIGSVNGDTITIEFDPSDIHGIYEKNVRYKPSRTPSTATLTLINGKVNWSLTRGKVEAGDLAVPRQMNLTRTKT